MRKQEHVNHCKEIAEKLDAIVQGFIFKDETDREWSAEYEPAYGFDMYVTNEWARNESGDYEKTRITLTTTDGETYTKSDDGATVDDIDEYLQPVTLWDYFENGTYNIEYRVPGRYEDPTSVQIMIACGGPNIYVDTKSGEVELYWWSESGSYPMHHDTVGAIDEYMTELYNC